MMKLKSEKGISLASLAISIVVLVILVNVVIYNMSENLKLRKLKAMQDDIDNLRSKISAYYAQNGEIPAKLKYTNIEHIKESGVISEAVDTGEFFVIDLSAIDNLTLNYGKDFEKVKNLEDLTDDEEKIYMDLYIINKESHNIFYVAGIIVEPEIFYTDYTSNDIDLETVELKDLNGKYVDGVRIPEGFYYIGGTKDTGIVISDIDGDDLENTKQGNQFVWVPVKNIDDFVRADWQNWDGTSKPTVLTNSSIAIENIDNDPTKLYRDMLNSVKENKGFYIARFEAGKEKIGGVDTVVSKKNQTPWTNISWGETTDNIGTEGAVYKALNFVQTNYTDNGIDVGVKSTLVYGTQWDAVLEWISKDNDFKNYITNSSQIGNYLDSDSTNNPAKTGAVDTYQIKNIYDLAGNVREWTMEQSGTDYKISRGGNYKANGSELPISSRNGDYPEHKDNTLGFRVALFISNDLKVGEIVKESNKTYTKNGTAIIPVGYMIVPGCDDVSEGLVISDDENDTEENPKNIVANGNQFVWIPVTDGNKYIRNTTYSSTYVSPTAIDDTNYLPEGITNEKQTVLNAGGFYIGRYGAGDSSASYIRKDEVEGTLVCKKNKYPYTAITQIDAKSKSKAFIDNNNVKSALISGIQWDVVMETINGKLDGNGQIYDVRKASNAEPSDRHTGNIERTGKNIADKVYNIYDLEGNVMEYIAEKQTYSELSPYVLRSGGSNGIMGASYRTTASGDSWWTYSFRLALYVMW